MAAADNASLGASADAATRPRGKHEPGWDYAALPFLLMPPFTLSPHPPTVKWAALTRKNPHLNKNESPGSRNKTSGFVSSFPS